MFESAELDHTIDKKTYGTEVEALRPQLLDAQYALLEEGSFPVVVLVNGVGGAGKSETVNRLNEWLDPRHVRSCAFGDENEGERERPAMWRFWQALPAKGKVAILFGSWYTDPIDGTAKGDLPKEALSGKLDRIRAFEQMLVDDGAVLVKLWFHLSKKGQRKRLTELHENKLTRWRVSKADWKDHEHYDRYRKVSENVLRETSTGAAPWIVIDGSDPHYRELTAAKTLLAAIRGRLAAPKKNTAKKKTNGASPPSVVAMLDTVNTSKILESLKFEEELAKDKYSVRIEEAQAKVGRLARKSKMKQHAVVAVFEGMDAAGKGGAIRRLTQALDARQYGVVPIAAPTDEERAHPYLWRFWRHLPRLGHIKIFDRSWYGRVLVERVEGFATPAAWSRAYREINEFEEELADSGIVVVKFWLAVTKEEQLKRFKEREKTKRKQFKITDEDWRNRKKWDDYIVAASDMIDRTSTAFAPWTIVEANDKHLARVKVIETVGERLAKVIG